MQTTLTKGNRDLQQKPWYAHRWPWLLMLGPALVIIAGVHTTWLAFSTNNALVVDDYYKQGKAINQDLRRDRAAAALGLRIEMRYDAARSVLAGRLESQSKQSAGAGSAIRVRLVHPTLPAKDLLLDARTTADGSFEVALPMLEQARWQVMAESAEGWRLTGVWQWPRERTVLLTPQV
jgi:hypothetical protein